MVQATEFFRLRKHTLARVRRKKTKKTTRMDRNSNPCGITLLHVESNPSCGKFSSKGYQRKTISPPETSSRRTVISHVSCVARLKKTLRISCLSAGSRMKSGVKFITGQGCTWCHIDTLLHIFSNTKRCSDLVR